MVRTRKVWGVLGLLLAPAGGVPAAGLHWIKWSFELQGNSAEFCRVEVWQ